MEILGMPYPIIKSPKGFLRTQEGSSQIKSDLLVLLLTNPGERCFLPSYGTPLKSLIFDQNDSVLAEKAREMIINSIKTWEPRIVIKAIDINNGIEESSLNDADTNENNEHILSIKIEFFDPENIKDVEVLKLEVPLSGS